MNPPKIALRLLPTVLVFSLLLGPPASVPAFEGTRAKSYVIELASDGYAGRQSGQPGGAKAEAWIAARFGEWGLVPAGQDGTFFHSFPLLATRERDASLTLLDSPFGRIDFLYGDDFTLVTNSGSADVTAEAVLVGHGLSSPDREWNDYAMRAGGSATGDVDDAGGADAAGDAIGGHAVTPAEDIDVAGKIVIIVRGTPDNGYDWGQGGSRDSTLHEAMRRGAAGVFFYSDNHAVQGAAVHDGSYFPKTPIGIASGHLLDHALMNTGWDLERYEKELKEGPVPLATGKRFRFRTKVTRVPEGTARNVVGVVRGADPSLADEILVIGSHMDHVGTSGGDIVYNGANDNASGTSVVMELARSFAAHRPPARTVVFVTFAGEEQGLLGSEAFVEDPPIDLDRVVGMVNCDMAGHGNGKVGIGGTEHWPEIRAAFRASLDSTRADSLSIARAWRGGSSDHGPFRDEGIATMNIWSEGDHRFYHTLQDDARWVDEAVLGSVGRMAEDWIRTLADWPHPLRADHRAGRAMLYASDQIDFDGPIRPGAPPWIRAGVLWLDSRDFASPACLDVLADVHDRVEADSLALVRAPKELRDATKSGKPGVIVGLSGSAERDGVAAVPENRRAFLAGLDVGIVRLGAVPPDSVALAAASKAGVVLLAPPESALLAALPKDAKRCIRFFPDRGERIAEPDSIPRKNTVFVLSCDAGISAADVVETVKALSPDRVHLDVAQWMRRSDESALCEFLEELQETGEFDADRMAALLGGNLARL